MPARTSVVTDWRVLDEEELPDVPPGGERERVIAPQKFVVLRRVVVRGPSLVRLGIGALADVPFELENVDGEVRRYRPKDVDQAPVKEQLAEVGAAAAAADAIAIAPGMEIHLGLRNESDAPVKPRAALLVQEEIS